MATASLLLSGAVQWAAALSFFVVARAVLRRAPEGGSRPAALAFAGWWSAMAAYMAIHGTLTVLAAAGVVPFPAHLAAYLVSIPLLCGGVGGLTYYFLFLFTGRKETWIPVAVVEAAAAVLYFTATAVGRPEGVQVFPWLVELAYANDPGLLFQLVYVAVGLPPVLGSLAYLGLLGRVHDRAQRYRVVLVSLSILAWVVTGYIARVSSGDFFVFVTLVVFGLLAAGGVLAAYLPPPGIRRWLERGAGHEARPEA